MKNTFVKKFFMVLGVSMFASAMSIPALAAENGTILWMSNQSSGTLYDFNTQYMKAICEQLGYDFSIVVGDGFNDPAANLNAVKSAMTDDVKGIILSQDGGAASIMEEYPDVYVAGLLSDMNSVYDESGANHILLENDHYLGTICDGHADGADTAKDFFDEVVEMGLHKIAVVNFPSYAYPNQAVIDEAFKTLVAVHNETASDDEKIELVGETTTLEFKPLEDSWFLEDGRDDLDGIICFMDGTSFVYPTMITAKANGTCRMDTRIFTSGLPADSSTRDDIGVDKNIMVDCVAAAELAAFPIVLLDNAISGNQFADWSNERIDSCVWVINSSEKMEAIKNNCAELNGDLSTCKLSPEVIADLCVKNNADATYANLVEIMQDDASIGVDAYLQ